VEPAWRALGGRPAILEAHVPFDRELSVLGARTRSGDVRFWPLVENEHRDGILRVSRAPAPAPAEVEREAVRHLGRLLQHLDHVGVATLELFACGNRLLANELAARVHNSGHWTWEGATTSQFENHLRAVADLPLGEVGALGPCAMVNAIGALPPAERVLAVPGATLHRYGKTPAPGRKLGHVTVLAPSPEALETRLARILALVGEPAPGSRAP
jgi:5-(carboxyamino)imidazole ribonucleotide synthase